MAKGYMGLSISQPTIEEFNKAVMSKQNKTKKFVSRSVCAEEAMLMFIKKYGVKG